MPATRKKTQPKAEAVAPATTTVAAPAGTKVTLDDAMIAVKVKDLVDALAPATTAAEKLKAAREGVKETKDSSIRALIAKVSGWNDGDFDASTVNIIARNAVQQLYGDPEDYASRLAEIKKVIILKDHMDPILQAVDKMAEDRKKANDKAAPLHVKETVLAIATQAKKALEDAGTLSKAALDRILADKRAKVVTAPASDRDRALHDLQSLAGSPVLRTEKLDSKGDVTILPEDVERALQTLRTRINGDKPEPEDVTTHPAYQALQERYDDVMQQLHAAHESLATTGHTTTALRSGPETAADPLEALDTPEEPEAPQSLADALGEAAPQPAAPTPGKGSRAKAEMQTVLGEPSIFGLGALLGMEEGGPKKK